MKYRKGSKLKRAALNIFVKLVKDVDIVHMRKEFDIIDQTKTGIITRKEMKTALKNAELEIKNSEINTVIRQLDFNHDGTISYSEFLAATIDYSKFLTDSKIKTIFS